MWYYLRAIFLLLFVLSVCLFYQKETKLTFWEGEKRDGLQHLHWWWIPDKYPTIHLPGKALGAEETVRASDYCRVIWGHCKPLDGFSRRIQDSERNQHSPWHLNNRVVMVEWAVWAKLLQVSLSEFLPPQHHGRPEQYLPWGTQKWSRED